MKIQSSSPTKHGFSLLELLMAVAVISMVAAVGIFSLSGAVEGSKDAATMRNAQQVCDTYAAARAAGVEFSAAAAHGILEELAAGKRGRGLFATSEFRLSLSGAEKRAVLKLCEYDAASGIIALRKR